MRFVDDEWNVQQRLIRLQVLAKSLKANELAQCLIQSLAVEYSIHPGVLLAAMKDGAAVNHAALEQVKFFFSSAARHNMFLAHHRQRWKTF